MSPITYSGASCSSAASRCGRRWRRLEAREDRLHQQRMLRHREGMRPAGLAVPARHAGQPVCDVVRSRCRAARGRAGRGGAPTACVARRAAARPARSGAIRPPPRPRPRRRESRTSPMPGIDSPTGTPPATIGRPASSASLTRSMPRDRQSLAPDHRAELAERAAAGRELRARGRQRRLAGGDQQRAAGRCRDAACATPPPGRHSSPCESRSPPSWSSSTSCGKASPGA